MAVELIEHIYQRQTQMRQFFIDHGEPTFAAEIQISGPKTLIFATASAFESEIVEHVRNFVLAGTRGNSALIGLIESKAISRQYHTWFDWEASNANRFLSLFGADFKAYAQPSLSNDPMKESVTSFLRVGNLRNQMVHQNYATFNLDKTLDEARQTCLEAELFVAGLPALLHGFVPQPDDEPGEADVDFAGGGDER